MLKTLPLDQLEVIAVAYQADETDEGRPVYDMDVLNTELWDDLQCDLLLKEHARCSCCGQRLKVACVVAHLPSREGYLVGRDCASKIITLQSLMGELEGRSMALIERAACNKREREFLRSHPEAVEAVNDSRLPNAPRLVKEIVEKIRRYGSLSEKQLSALIRISADNKLRRSTATGTAPVGRQTVQGVIISAKQHRNDMRGGPEFTTKLVIDLGNGVRVYGSKPESVNVVSGQQVKFTATFEPSKTDNLFGYFKRPSKMVIE